LFLWEDSGVLLYNKQHDIITSQVKLYILPYQTIICGKAKEEN
jgi:hypothetical protein